MYSNGLPEEPVFRRARPQDDPFRLLYMGQLRREKGAHLLPAIMAGLGDDVRLDIAGTGALAGALTQAAANDPRMVLRGFVQGDTKRDLLDRADALLFPSTWTENAPVVLVEAFMRGLPVIASQLGAIPEFVDQGVNGLLAEAGNASDFAQACRTLQTAPAFARALSTRASQTAAQFTVGAMGRRYMVLYERCVQQVENR